MDEEEMLQFRSKEEEAKYWKETSMQFRDRVEELEKELEDFQENSSQLERELEKSLEHADKTNRDLQLKCSKLNINLDLTKEKYEQLYNQTSKQLSEQEEELTEFRQKEEKLLKFIRELEQKNDDLERYQRVIMESVSDRDVKLNTAIERNALLENELDEKELLKATIQRQKDEIRDLQQELNRYIRQAMPDNDKVLERMRSPASPTSPVDSNKLFMETQTTAANANTMKSKGGESLGRCRSLGHFAIAVDPPTPTHVYKSQVQYSPVLQRPLSIRNRNVASCGSLKDYTPQSTKKDSFLKRSFRFKLNVNDRKKGNNNKHDGKENGTEECYRVVSSTEKPKKRRETHKRDKSPREIRPGVVSAGETPSSKPQMCGNFFSSFKRKNK